MGSLERSDDHSREILLKKSPSPAAVSDSPKIEWAALADKLAVQDVSKCRPDQWGLLTAVSDKGRKRTQGQHIVLHSHEHVLGRMVTEISCLFDSPAVSGRHCTLTRRLVTFDGRAKTPGSDRAAGDMLATFVKDSSSNGTFINREKLKKNGPEVRLRHGDIISLVALPEHENAFAFVFREVGSDEGATSVKRKGSSSENHLDREAEESSGGGGGGKRIRGGSTAKAGMGVIQGPVSLDDVRRLQRSNEELRQQLESNVLEMEKMRGEFRAAEGVHVVELKDLRASVAKMHEQQIEEMRVELLSKTKELEESAALCVQRQAAVEDLNHRLASAAQSKADAEETIRSHTGSINELKKRLEDEFSLRQKERTEWEANLEATVERIRTEATEESKRHSEASARLQKQQQDIIADLKEAEKENRHLADALRVKLEDERQAVVRAEEKCRRLGVQMQEERLATENASRKTAELEEDVRKLDKELQSERRASESAAAKVANLEVAVEIAVRDLTLEKQRLQGARERIVLRETQLRAFYSTAAQVDALQQKQQEQLKVMMRALEDGDGEGDYSQTKKGRTEVGHDSIGFPARILAGLANRQMSGGGHLAKRKGLAAPNGEVNGKSEQKERLVTREGEGRADQKADWMGGDTQPEDTQPEVNEYPIVGSNLPSSTPTFFSGDFRTELQSAATEGRNRGTNGESLNHDQDTQMLQDKGLDVATQLLTDTLQVGSSYGDALRGGSGVGLGTRLSNEQGKSGLGAEMDVDMDVDVDAPAFLSRGDRTVRGGHHGDPGEGNEQAEQDIMSAFRMAVMKMETIDSGQKATESDQVQAVPDSLPANEDSLPDGAPAPASAPNDAATMRANEHPSLETRRKSRGGATICTDDLLTSEVAGSWALGTQASVHTGGGNEGGSPWNVGSRMSGDDDETQGEEGRYKQAGTICTEDLLASEAAGSWAVGTPASVHADNESMSSEDERNPHPGPEEGGSQVAATVPEDTRSRPNPYRLLSEDVMRFADPVNSQNSLSPATTNLVPRNERGAANNTTDDIVEPGLRTSEHHGLSAHDSDSASTTDGENEDDDDDVHNSNKGEAKESS